MNSNITKVLNSLPLNASYSISGSSSKEYVKHYATVLLTWAFGFVFKYLLANETACSFVLK